MNLNRIYCCATVPLMCLSAYGGVSQQEREFLSKYNAIEMRSSCGNSFGATGDHLLAQYGVSERRMGLLLVEQVEDCLRIEPPRASGTNDIIIGSLLKLQRYRVPEALPVAQSAFLDASDAFRPEALRAFYCCASNVEDVVGFVTNVWADVSDRAASRRLDCVMGLNRWISETCSSPVVDRQGLYEAVSNCAQSETRLPIAMRLDHALQNLSPSYSASSIRTNLVQRFMNDTTAPVDPLYFRRQAESMGIYSEVQ